MRATTLLRRVLTRATEPSPSSETQALRAPKAAANAWKPTWIRFFTFSVCGLTRASVSVDWLATQTLPAPDVSPYGLWPRRIFPLTLAVVGSIRTSRLPVRSVVQTEPKAETRIPPVVPIWIFEGVPDAGACDADAQAVTATKATASASVRRYRKVVALYHKVDVNGTAPQRRRRPHDPP